ncbi:deleted in malignant brain tumors 1 protein-like [Dreissena polymorpha]|uniref:SRCR domain-containing protein n=1 Tax=Dreissena polymorpha TaxID=45954 RepID=A0A9D4LSD3_DREPO|nr:deleted in malignant brain tumors 1 protein-like [Dreissena polymorpha]KAH3863004.1 hypothetical protein DPMN_025980 [Dreissena polymorpha]
MICLVIFLLGLAYQTLAQGNSPFHGNATQARLVGGSSNATGLLEVLYKGDWMHISSTSASYFTQTEAKVVCNMLGYGNSLTAYAFGPGNGNKLFGSLHSQGLVNIQFNCQGTEPDLTQCRGWSNSFSPSAGYQGYDVALSCERTQLRLQDGDTSHSGRVEMFIKGDWHSICDTGFDDSEAQVVCNMLGLHSTGIAKAYRGSHFGQGAGEIVIGSLTCKGNEADIMECNPAFDSSCNHRNDAGVNCDSTPVRLVDGPTNTSGRVEVLHGGTWGTICGDSNFDSKAVQVICRMIGVNNPHAFGYGYAYYGEGQGYIVINQLRCDGTESDISTCRSYEWNPPGSSSSFGCSHTQDAGVNCNGQTLIRLSDGVSEQSGRLEVLHNGHWGTVSSYGFDNHDLAVVCRMLGYEYSANSFYMPNGYYGQGIGEVLVRDLACHGMESDIGLCGGNWWPKTNPGDHNQDVGVNCDGVIPIRLGGDGNATAGVGRVEILHNSQYGTVCSSNFDRLDLVVVCRMLGYNNIPTSAYWYHGPTYAQGLGEITVTNLACNGIEGSIGQCGGQWPATRSCSHDNDVFVNCLGASEKIRLVGGSNNFTGRVEIYHAGQWGTICDNSFDRTDAVVICRIMGFQNPERAVAYTRAHFGAADSHVPMVMTDLQCNGLETTLGQCNPTWQSKYCTHNQDIGVDCCPSCQPSIVG